MGLQHKVSPERVVQWTDPASGGVVLLEDLPLTRATGGLWASPPSLEAPVCRPFACCACLGFALRGSWAFRTPGQAAWGQHPWAGAGLKLT